MTVLDASVVVDLLLDLPPHAEALRQRVASEALLAAPHLLDAEVGQVIRRRVLAGKLERDRAEAALDDLLAMPLRRHPHGGLVVRAFELRDNVTFYDAFALALAEGLGHVPGCTARVEVVA
jgi:predicted nucleic acid-binding protein